MPIPAVLLPSLIQAGGSLLGTGANALSQGMQNKKMRRWNEKMYDWQRRDSLSDYHMQNLYNHPSSQMARLREAGLNPNLVYGNGAVATGGQVRSSGVESWNPKAPEFDIGGAIQAGLQAYMITDMKEAQHDNLRMQNTVMTQDAALKAAQIESVLADTATKTYDLGYKNEIRDISIDALRSSVDKTKAETTQVLTQTEIAAVMKAPNLEKAIQEVLLIRKHQAKTDAEIRHIDAAIENLKTDNKIKQEDLRLKEAGIQPHDPIVRRLVAIKIAEIQGRIKPQQSFGNKLSRGQLSKQGKRLY